MAPPHQPCSPSNATVQVSHRNAHRALHTNATHCSEPRYMQDPLPVTAIVQGQGHATWEQCSRTRCANEFANAPVVTGWGAVSSQEPGCAAACLRCSQRRLGRHAFQPGPAASRSRTSHCPERLGHWVQARRQRGPWHSPLAGADPEPRTGHWNHRTGHCWNRTGSFRCRTVSLRRRTERNRALGCQLRQVGTWCRLLCRRMPLQRGSTYVSMRLGTGSYWSGREHVTHARAGV